MDMAKPTIRFKGYQDDWEQRKVTDLGEIYIGLVTTMTEHYTDKGHLLIRNSDIKDGYFEFGENPIYLDEEFSEQNKSRMHQLGDVITVHTGDIGTSAVIGENEVNSIGFATIVTRPNQEILDSNYFATYLNTDTHKQWAISMATGDGRSNYNLKDYTKLVVPIPEIEEQKKIATCIVNLNSLITLHQRKCDETKRLKKYLLQKMFPQNGEKVPEIRFSGFTDDWEQRKLNEIADKVSEKNKNNEFSEPFTNSAEQGIISQKDYFDREIVNNENLNGYYIVRNDDFIYNPRISVTAPVGPINRNRLGRNGVMSPLYTVFRTHDINNLYLEFYFKTTKWHRFMKLNGDSGARFDRFTISSTQFMEMPIPYPTLEEQQKIGEYFDSLDHLITLHQRELDNFQNIKRFMLGKMFV